MIIKDISLERLQQIENERNQTQMDPNFQKWIKQLNVSVLHTNRDGIDRANQLMDEWDKEKLFKFVHTFNF